MDVIVKVIPGTNGIYSATSDGKIISNRTGLELVGGIDECGYKRVCLSINDGQITKKAHRLIAETFIENPCNKPQVNHIDGCKTNNRIDNLEWCTASENVTHAFNTLGIKSHGGHLGVLGADHHLSISVVAIAKNGEQIVFGAMKEAERMLPGVSARKVSEVCSGKRKTHAGYQWRYAS